MNPERQREPYPGEQQRPINMPNQNALGIPNKLIYIMSGISTSAMLFGAGYFYGLGHCKSFADKLKDFLF